MPQGDFVVAATAVLLGQAGLAAQRADRDRIAKGGRTPLVVALLEQQVGSMTVLVTTIGLVPPTRHCQ